MTQDEIKAAEKEVRELASCPYSTKEEKQEAIEKLAKLKDKDAKPN